MSLDSPLSSPGVRFPPPLLFAAGLALGAAIEYAGWALPFSDNNSTAWTLAGAVLITAGAALAVWGVATFLAARTAIMPHHAASRIVTSGPYRFTRNPMYVGMTLAYVGVGFLMNSWWPAVLLPLVLVLLVMLVIRREEAYLGRAFRDEYALYRTRTRRWL